MLKRAWVIICFVIVKNVITEAAGLYAARARASGAGAAAPEQTPAKQTPAEQTPAEQTPAEQAPAEQTPAEQTPNIPAPATNTYSMYKVNVTANSSVIVKPGVIFPASAAYRTLYGDSDCFCGRLCQEDPKCKHSCWITYPEIGYCRLSALNYSQIAQLNRISGRTAFTMPSNVFLGPDNKFYFVVDKLMTYEDATNTCKSQDNFQLGIYLTILQYHLLFATFSNYGKPMWVNMNYIKNDPDAYAVWADGTPFSQTEISQMGLARLSSSVDSNNKIVKFRFDGTSFVDSLTTDNDKFSVLCQESVSVN